MNPFPVLPSNCVLVSGKEQVAKGEISESRAKLLKGGHMLGMSLKYATKWVPIFGDEASEITGGSFEAFMKFGNKLAKHTTKTDCCSKDPENAECCVD